MRLLPPLYPVGLLLVLLLGAVAWGQQFSAEDRSHWSLMPRSQAVVPDCTEPGDALWARNAVDRFVLARRAALGLGAAPEANRTTYIRRVTFQLLGLPPTAEEVADFTADRSPDAYERLVDRLLASPRYGEHWGQHWLDVVRYAETEGFEYDRLRPGAWRYRDYVIAGINADKPYDQFVTEQLAGDELAQEGDPGWQEHQVAAGFHRLGPVRRNAGNLAVAFSRNEVLTEATNIVGSAFLGLTLGCARCHDHMFDPIRQRDYYSMQAFLAATHERDVQLAGPDELQAWQRKTKEVETEMARLKKAIEAAAADEKKGLEQQLLEAESRLPPPLPTISTVWNDTSQQSPVHVLARGDVDRPLEEVQMRVLGVLSPDDGGHLRPEASNPRTALATWITDPANPLTARVIVNRLWHYHFGTGIVSTPNDFGLNGASPSHPELLDYLANRLVQDGWQLKPLHRLIVLSGTYRQASVHPDAAAAEKVDSRNRFLWHYPRRRLTAEEIRDSMLLVSGRLNLQAGGESVVVPVEQELVDLLYKPSQWQVTPDRAQHDRRSVYLLAKRNLRLPFLETFDQPDLQTSCARRVSSTHPPQSLEMLNGGLPNDLAGAFAQRLAEECGANTERIVERGFLLALGRAPHERERRVTLAFLAHHPVKEFALALFNLNAFLYVE